MNDLRIELWDIFLIRCLFLVTFYKSKHTKTTSFPLKLRKYFYAAYFCTRNDFSRSDFKRVMYFILKPPAPVFNGLPPMRSVQAPAQYACYNDVQIVGNIYVQNIFDLNGPQQTPIADTINSQSQSPVNIL
jgi:hypothetical protein